MTVEGFCFIVIEFCIKCLGAYSHIIFYIDLECSDTRKKSMSAVADYINVFLMFTFF